MYLSAPPYSPLQWRTKESLELRFCVYASYSTFSLTGEGLSDFDINTLTSAQFTQIFFSTADISHFDRAELFAKAFIVKLKCTKVKHKNHYNKLTLLLYMKRYM